MGFSRYLIQTTVYGIKIQNGANHFHIFIREYCIAQLFNKLSYKLHSS